MKRYELVKAEKEIPYKDRHSIHQGCTLEDVNQLPETIQAFDNLDDALDTLDGYHTEVVKTGQFNGMYIYVTEYSVVEKEYDEDGEFIGSGNVWAFSKMPEEWN